MTVNNSEIYRQAYGILTTIYGPDAAFRDGQYEAIEATMVHHRTLVVQRTGWGKSLVYFIATKLLRSKRGGVTLVVSPLLALMQNQMDAAETIGLRCEALNSTVKDRRQEILQALIQGELDLLLITPETLFREDVQSQLAKINIGLFVIDEAHCISDWGHDFRLPYARLREVIRMLPPMVPVLATTATANDRVVNDLKTQLGEDVFVSRGPLTRDSLAIQVLQMPSVADRYAWILDNLPKMEGSGIVYCLTQRDCDYLTAFLTKHGISAMSYYSRDSEAEEQNRVAEGRFRRNEIKALVATVKLGMGYDKGDIAFVIHFQMPSNIVSYYQQIGRAGRNIDRAYAVLMHGKEDDEIIDYFIRTAFPTEQEMKGIITAITESGGLRKTDIESRLNIRRARIEKVLTFLENDGFIYREKMQYFASAKPYHYDAEHYDSITAIRRRELEQMRSLVQTKDCYSRFIVNALDDHSAGRCGCCSNCVGRPLFPETPSFASRAAASAFIDGLRLSIEPRKMWAASGVTKCSKIKYVNQPGLCLSKYGDPGYGALVKRDKYSAAKRFCDELVGRSAELLRPLIEEYGITHITCVPSLRSRIVSDFAKRLAESCRLEFSELLVKQRAEPQKKMENGSHQCENAFRSFSVMDGVTVPKRVLLVDDVVDSRWTLTVCGYRLMEKGCSEVFPFALADSSHMED